MSGVPVITIDGPTASGKGTVAQRVAKALGWNYLDSGAIYRACALYAMDNDLALEDFDAVAKVAAKLPLRFGGFGNAFLADENVSDSIRSEAIGNAASKISVAPQVRAALLQRQRDFLTSPGLVTDGRDMGTVVFPLAPLKIYLTATPEARAQRRYNQLIEKGNPAIMEDLVADLTARDRRDSERSTAPLRPADESKLLDTSELDAGAAAAQVLLWWHAVATKKQSYAQ